MVTYPSSIIIEYMFIEPLNTPLNKQIETSLYWSGGAKPAHGMSAKRVERAALGRLVLRASVRPSVRTYVTRQKGPKRASKSLESHWVFTKSEHVKSLFEKKNPP